MNRKIESRFFVNYVLMFIISTLIGASAFILTDFASHVLSKTLAKNNYTADMLMEDDYSRIDTAEVIKNGGGVQVINKDYEVVFSQGINTFPKDRLSVSEFTDFLTKSKSVGIPYSYSIAYHSAKEFWLVVTFPTSVRVDFSIVHNKEYRSVDMKETAGAITAVFIFYFILLTISTLIYSKLSSFAIVNPLRKLLRSTQRLKDGDYSARVNLNLKNEFGELQDTFNAMAEQIEQEIFLRKESEERRKKLILDLSHDLKNPLAGMMGYAELCMNEPNLTIEKIQDYLRIIFQNSQRANLLMTELFELSKIESPAYAINKSRIDLCEYLRERIAEYILLFEGHGFSYEFEIPEEEIFIEMDAAQFDRVLQNLVNNAIRYNPPGTKIAITLKDKGNEILIKFQDDGVGIPEKEAKEIFQPFVRVPVPEEDTVSAGTGLGLAIAEKIVIKHGGTIGLVTESNSGCEFLIRLPKF